MDTRIDTDKLKSPLSNVKEGDDVPIQFKRLYNAFIQFWQSACT